MVGKEDQDTLARKEPRNALVVGNLHSLGFEYHIVQPIYCLSMTPSQKKWDGPLSPKLDRIC